MVLTAVQKKKMYIVLCALTISCVAFFSFDLTTHAMLTQKINGAGDSFMKTLKDILKIVVIVVLAICGYKLFISKTAEGLADLKAQALTILAAMFLILGGEWIYDWVAGFFS